MKNCFAIRGATTVEIDNPAEMDEAVSELFDQIVTRNRLDLDDIAYILLSQTPDLKTENAATCLRKTGKCDSIPLFCLQEAEIHGMMDHVIRLLVVVGRPAESPAKMVFLRRAAALRPDLREE